jgi:HK97 gp10 family phage protein
VIDLSVKANTAHALNTLHQASRKASKGLASSTRHAAAIVRKQMVDLMPQGSRANPSRPGQPPHRRTGRLARSIRFSPTGDGGQAIFSNRRTPEGLLAHLMETGTRHMKPRPFIRPAVNRSLARLPMMMKTEIARAF